VRNSQSREEAFPACELRRAFCLSCTLARTNGRLSLHTPAERSEGFALQRTIVSYRASHAVAIVGGDSSLLRPRLAARRYGVRPAQALQGLRLPPALHCVSANVVQQTSAIHALPVPPGRQLAVSKMIAGSMKYLGLWRSIFAASQAPGRRSGTAVSLPASEIPPQRRGSNATARRERLRQQFPLTAKREKPEAKRLVRRWRILVPAKSDHCRYPEKQRHDSSYRG
jgi:hypothetical protein